MTTIADLLYDDPSDTPRSILECLHDLNVTAQLPDPLTGLDDLTNQLAEAITAFLQMPVGSLLFAAWAEAHGVQQACHDTLGKTGATTTVTLKQQTLTSTQQPTIDIECAGQHWHVLDLVLSLTLQFDVLPITVSEGHVARVGTASCSSNASLAITTPGGHVHILASKILPKLQLPLWDRPTLQVNPPPRTNTPVRS